MFARKKWSAILTMACGMWSAPGANAATNFVPTNLAVLDNLLVDALIKTAALTSDHRAYAGPSPLGTLIGLDIGTEGTLVQTPSAFSTALVFATGKASAQIPQYFGVAKVNARKGLPFGFDLGFSYSKIAIGGVTYFQSYGGDVQWAPMGKRPAPISFAVRGSYSTNRMLFIRTQTVSADLLLGKKWVIIEPYVGVGLQRWSGRLEVPFTVPTGLIDLDKSGTSPRALAGIDLRLGVLRFVPEVSYSMERLLNGGARFAFAF